MLFRRTSCSLIHNESSALTLEEDTHERHGDHPTRYLAPDWFTRRVFNPLVARLTRWGISVKGSRVLEVRGRTSGEIRTTVVNLLTVDGVRYLVAPRGETQWVRNLRADGGARRAARRPAPRAVRGHGARRCRQGARCCGPTSQAWAWEVGRFFDGLRADSPAADLAAAAPGFPVFRIG